MTLLSKPIDTITFEDVVDFCNKQKPEGIFLDYKQEFSSKSSDQLVNTIAAMANTLGGVILIGVKEDAEKPSGPFEGFPYDESFHRKVQDLVLGNIVPPLLIENAVCRDSSGDNCFVMVRVPQSNATPHAVGKGIYVRTGQRNSQESIANVDQLAWLLSNRKVSVETKRLLSERSDIRFEHYLKELFGSHKLPGLSNAWIKMSCCPTFIPEAAFFKIDKAQNILKSLDSSGGGESPGASRPVAGGWMHVKGSAHESSTRLMLEKRPPAGAFTISEIDQYGLFVERFEIQEMDNQPIYYRDLLQQSAKFLERARRFLEKIEHWGWVDLRLDIHSIAGKALNNTGFVDDMVRMSKIVDEPVSVSRTFLAVEIMEEFHQLRRSLLQEHAHALSITGVSDGFLESIFPSEIVQDIKGI